MKFFAYLVAALAVLGLTVTVAPLDGLASASQAEPEAIGGQGCLCEGTKRSACLLLGMLSLNTK